MAAPNVDSLIEWAGGSCVTLAVVFTDIVRGTELGRQLGNVRMKEVKDAHYARADALISGRNGQFIKTIGDAVLGVFKAVPDAVEFARIFHSEPGPVELRGRVRAGVHHGEVEVKDADTTPRDVTGTEVDFAARVVGHIRDAEIWLSAEAMKAIRRHEGTAGTRNGEWAEHPDVVFKGFEDEPPVTLWSLAQQGSAAPAARSTFPPALVLSPRPVSINDRQPIRRAENFEIVDFLSHAEALIEQPRDRQERRLFVRAHFRERMSVIGEKATYEFGVGRFYVHMCHDGLGTLSPADDLRNGVAPAGVELVRLHAPETPGRPGVTVSVDAEPGRAHGRNAIPQIGDDNRFPHLATASADVETGKLSVELLVLLRPGELHMDGEVAIRISDRRRKCVEAIAAVMARKGQAVDAMGLIRKVVPVRERRGDD